MKASMAMENMPLTDGDVQLLKQYQVTREKEQFREQLLTEYTEV